MFLTDWTLLLGKKTKICIDDGNDSYYVTTEIQGWYEEPDF